MKGKNEEGITLIALVVTIIVLLILAAVSLSMLTGENGILTNAKEARDRTREANAKEIVQVEIQGSYDSKGNIDIDLLNKNLKRLIGITHSGKPLDEEPITELPTDVELDGFTISIEENGNINVKENANVNPGGDEPKEDDTQTITIPSEATLSKIPGEYEDIDNGVVIYVIPEDEKENVDWEADVNNNGILDVQEKYDQFVWVPVPNAIVVDENGEESTNVDDIERMMLEEKYPMAIKKRGTENYRGLFYNFSLLDGKVLVENGKNTLPSSSEWREPAYLSSYVDSDGSKYNNIGISQEVLQTRFNEMVEKVSNNGGFWLGRYETSNMNGGSSLEDKSYDEIQQVKIVKNAKKGVSGENINWYRMYEQQKNYIKHVNFSLQSSIIWGSQWNQILLWMRNVKNESKNSYYIINSLTMGNFDKSDDAFPDTSSPAPTGCYQVKNVYDLAGNLLEWSLAPSDSVSGNRDARGGCFNFGSSLKDGGSKSPGSADVKYGTRMTIY